MSAMSTWHDCWRDVWSAEMEYKAQGAQDVIVMKNIRSASTLVDTQNTKTILHLPKNISTKATCYNKILTDNTYSDQKEGQNRKRKDGSPHDTSNTLRFISHAQDVLQEDRKPRNRSLRPHTQIHHINDFHIDQETFIRKMAWRRPRVYSPSCFSLLLSIPIYLIFIVDRGL